MRRMLWNIVDNGIKYTSAGGKVEISSALDDGYVRINVKDTGVRHSGGRYKIHL